MEILENVLSIEKMKHLQELGVNTGNASMTWMLYPYEEGNNHNYLYESGKLSRNRSERTLYSCIYFS